MADQKDSPTAGLSSHKLSHHTRVNFRQTSPMMSTTSEGVKFNALHSDPLCRAGTYSATNRQVHQVQHALSGHHDDRIAGESGRSWTRIRSGSVPGSNQFRYFFNNPEAVESSVTKVSPRKASFREAVAETANMDGEQLRYTLKSNRSPSQITTRQAPEMVKTNANNTHRFLRYAHPGTCGRRKQQASEEKGVSPILSPPPAPPSAGTIARRRRRQMLQGASNIWATPNYPEVKQKVTGKVGQIPVPDMATYNKMPTAGIPRMFT